MNTRNTPKNNPWLGIFVIFFLFASAALFMRSVLTKPFQKSKKQIAKEAHVKKIQSIILTRHEKQKETSDAEELPAPQPDKAHLHSENKTKSKRNRNPIAAPDPSFYIQPTQLPKQKMVKRRTAPTQGEVRAKIQSRKGQKNQNTILTPEPDAFFEEIHVIDLTAPVIATPAPAEKINAEPPQSKSTLKLLASSIFSDSILIREAKAKLILHAENMLQWSCHTTRVPFAAMGLHEFIKVMSFLHDFHCFNRAKQMLSNNDSERANNDLYTWFYSAHNEMNLGAQLITESQKIMRHSLIPEVIHLLQKHSAFTVNNSACVANLLRLSDGSKSKEKSCPETLMNLFSQTQDSLISHQLICDKMDIHRFLFWLEYLITPLINILNELIFNSEKIPVYRFVTDKEVRETLKMLILFVGDYFSEARSLNIVAHLPLMNTTGLEKAKHILDIMDSCTRYRDRILKGTVDSAEDHLAAIAMRCNKLNSLLLDFTKINLFALLQPGKISTQMQACYLHRNDLIHYFDSGMYANTEKETLEMSIKRAP